MTCPNCGWSGQPSGQVSRTPGGSAGHGASGSRSFRTIFIAALLVVAALLVTNRLYPIGMLEEVRIEISDPPVYYTDKEGVIEITEYDYKRYMQGYSANDVDRMDKSLRIAFLRNSWYFFRGSSKDYMELLQIGMGLADRRSGAPPRYRPVHN